MPAPDHDSSGNDPRSPPTGRIVELQNPLDRAFYHPIAASLAGLLARTAVTPNTVSVLGGMAIVLAGIAYVQPGWPLPVVLGLLFHMAWHVLDGTDGDLARRTGRVSASGEIIDGICDYAGHAVLYLLLALSASAVVGVFAWALAVAAGLSRILQANFYEVQRRQYANWAYGVPWLRSNRAGAGQGMLAAAARIYLGIASSLAPRQPEIDDAASDPSRCMMVSRQVKEMGPAAFAGSSLLGANYRTLALGLSMLFGSPLWYFAYETVFLNILLARSVARSKRNLAELRMQLQPAPSTSR